MCVCIKCKINEKYAQQIDDLWLAEKVTFNKIVIKSEMNL